MATSQTTVGEAGKFHSTDPSKPPPLPQAWKTLGVKKGFDPPPSTRLRMFITARFGFGKSTFMMSRPKTLVLSREDSGSFVSSPKAHHKYPPTWKDFTDILGQLEKDSRAGRRYFECIGFDTIDDFLPIFDDNLSIEYSKEKDSDGKIVPLRTISEYGTHGKGTAILYSAVSDTLDALEEWGYSWMCSSHITEKTLRSADGTEYTGLRISAPPGLIKIIGKRADFLVGVNKKTFLEDVKGKIIVVEGKKIATSKKIKRTSHLLTADSTIMPETKNRLPGMSLEMELPRIGGWDKFDKVYTDQCAKIKKTENQ